MKSREEILEVGTRFNELLKQTESFADKEDIELITKAFNFASDTYKNSYTVYGAPYITHSLEVAKIAVEEVGLGAKGIAGALLHDMLLGTDITTEDLAEHFDPTICSLVENYARISNIPTERITLQSDKFRNLFLTMVDDIRVILVKLCHRIYDLRIIDRLPADRQQNYIRQIEHIYIPIAHRLGLYKVKQELEDLLMKFHQNEIYLSIKDKLNATEPKRKLFIKEFIDPVERELIKQGFTFDIKGRPKSIPSIWEKMQKQDVSLEEVYDLFAMRIIVNSEKENEKADCWKIYSIVTNIYPPFPKRLRDWISTPKASGYESLHTTVKGPMGRWVEVQIRSSRMNTLAEKGQASHWRYKGFDEKELTDEWLSQVRDILENPDQIKFEATPEKQNGSKKIFAFTPTGDLKELPEGATVLDFAYEIHTRVGDQCNGAKVNGQVVPIRHVLKNGDKVEIITSKNQKPKQDWLKFVTTSKAKNKIKRTIKEQKFSFAERGVDILKRKLKNWKLQYNDEVVNALVQHYKFSSSIDLYYKIADEKLDLNEIKRIVTDKDKPKEKQNENNVAVKSQELKTEEKSKDHDLFVIDNSLENVNYRLAKCCNPIPGDSVFGFVTIGKGISIHRKSCPNAKRLLQDYGYREMKVSWKKTDDSFSLSSYIKIIGEDRIGILGDITNVISKDLKVNMQNIKIESKGGQFFGTVKVAVKSNKHLDELLHKISKLKGVNKANRVDS